MGGVNVWMSLELKTLTKNPLTDLILNYPEGSAQASQRGDSIGVCKAKINSMLNYDDSKIAKTDRTDRFEMADTGTILYSHACKLFFLSN